jgi:hypothetical protein
MSEEELERKVLDRVGVDRRAFVKRMLRGAAFTVPVIASFDMNSALAEAKKARRKGVAQIQFSNSTQVYFGNGWENESEHYFPYDLHHGDNPDWQTT